MRYQNVMAVCSPENRDMKIFPHVLYVLMVGSFTLSFTIRTMYAYTFILSQPILVNN